MTPNKALQSTQPTQPAYLSSQQEISAPGVSTHVQDGDYPQPIKRSLLEVKTILYNRGVIMQSLRMQGQALEILVIIAQRWVDEQKSSTVYSLCNGNCNHIMMNYRKVARLHAKGLLQVVGVGNHNSKSYAPTSAGLSVLAPLCKVV